MRLLCVAVACTCAVARPLPRCRTYQIFQMWQVLPQVYLQFADSVIVCDDALHAREEGKIVQLHQLVVTHVQHLELIVGYTQVLEMGKLET